MSSKFVRPSHIPFPSVWHTFKAKDLNSSNIITYRVQDLTEDYFEAAIDLLKVHFIPHEAVGKAVNIVDEPVTVNQLIQLWKECFQKKVSLACFREGSDELVGVNVLDIETPDHENFEWHGPKGKFIYEMTISVSKKVNMFEKYGVPCYLYAYGLCVDSRFRGRGIATEILRARVPLGQALGIKLTSNVFTGLGASVATKAGFKIEHQATYAELSEAGFHMDKMDPKEAMTLMSLVIE